MKRVRLTRWYPAGTVPLRSGIYETRVAEGLHAKPAEWIAESQAWYSAEGVYKGHLILWQNREWRGLDSPPRERSAAELRRIQKDARKARPIHHHAEQRRKAA